MHGLPLHSHRCEYLSKSRCVLLHKLDGKPGRLAAAVRPLKSVRPSADPSLYKIDHVQKDRGISEKTPALGTDDRQQATYSHQACPTETVSIILRTSRRVCAQRLVFLPLLTGPALFHAARVFAENVARVTDTVVPCEPAKVSTWAPS
jgi:hypothetical protein